MQDWFTVTDLMVQKPHHSTILVSGILQNGCQIEWPKVIINKPSSEDN